MNETGKSKGFGWFNSSVVTLIQLVFEIWVLYVHHALQWSDNKILCFLLYKNSIYDSEEYLQSPEGVQVGEGASRYSLKAVVV